MNRTLSFSSVVVLALCVAGCVSQTVRTVDMTPPRQAATYLPEPLLLNVGVAIFDENVPEDFDERIEQLIFPEVRRTESQYFPYFLKNTLQATGNWGAVRVIPRPTLAVDVNVEGKILHSDGESMALEVRVSDARGIEWFTREYEALASKYAYEPTIPASIDAFQAVYKGIADDMLTYMENMEEADITRLRTIAEMKFAQDFAPDAFSTHVETDENGVSKLQRLPAEDDPMLARVQRVREREYLFIDTLDEYYTNFYRQMFPTYQDFRRSSFDQVIAYKRLKEQARSRAIGGTLAIVGSVGAIYESSDAYVDASGLAGVGAGAGLIVSSINKANQAEMQAERLRELGNATEAELVPTTIELENQTARLEGTVQQQYQQLRQILRRVYFEDMNLPLDDLAESSPDE